MVDPITSRRWLFRGLFLLISAVVVFFQLLPLDLSAGRWPGPDVVVGFRFCLGSAAAGFRARAADRGRLAGNGSSVHAAAGTVGRPGCSGC